MTSDVIDPPAAVRDADRGQPGRDPGRGVYRRRRLAAAGPRQWLRDNTAAFFGQHLGNQVSAELADWIIGLALDAALPAAERTWRSSFETDFRAELPKVEVPALVVHGDADVSAPVATAGRRTASLIPGARYVEYPRATHGLFVTHADQLNADLLAFGRE